MLGDLRQHGACPRPARVRPIHSRQPRREPGEVVLAQGRRGGKLGARIGLVGSVQANPVQRRISIAAQVVEQLVDGVVAGFARLGFIDVSRGDDVDRVDLDHAGAGAVAVTSDDLTALPAPERQLDRAALDSLTQPGLKPHPRSLT